MTATLTSLSSLPVHQLPPIEHPSLDKALLGYLKTTDGMRKLVMECFHNAADWFCMARPSVALGLLSANVKQLKSFACLAKLPEEFVKTSEQVKTAHQEKSGSSAAQLVNRISCFLMPASDVADALQQRVFSLGARSIMAINVVGSAALAVSGLFDLLDNIGKVQKASQPVLHSENGLPASQHRREIHAIQGAWGSWSAVSDIAWGGLLFTGAVTNIVVAPWIILALSTSSLVCGLGSRFSPYLRSPVTV